MRTSSVRKKTISTSVRACAGRALAVAAVVGSTILIPSGAAYAGTTPTCQDDSRKTAVTASKQSDMREMETEFSNGSLHDAEITLRYTRSMECAWGLLEGEGGTIWLERAPTNSGGIDRLRPQRITPEKQEWWAGTGHKKKVTHTVAADLTKGAIRACGEGVDGKEGSSASVGVGPQGPNATVGTSSESSDAGTQCTQWVSLGGALSNEKP